LLDSRESQNECTPVIPSSMTLPSSTSSGAPFPLLTLTKHLGKDSSK
jgi:hypothetical protein